MLDTLEKPVELWDTFKRESLHVAKDYFGEHPLSRGEYVTAEMLECVKKSCTDRLAGNRD